MSRGRSAARTSCGTAAGAGRSSRNSTGETAEIVPELARAAGVGLNAPVVYVPRDSDPAPLTAVEKATAWLRGLLAVGPWSSAGIRARAEKDGYAWRTVERARDLLGLVVSKSSGRWTWAMPELGGVVGGVDAEAPR